MGLFKKYVNQTRKPEGLLGNIMVRGMNKGHAKLSDWGLSHLKTTAPKEMLELGCGGGRNIKALLKKYPSAKITAIDYSNVSVKKAIRYNQKMIAEGRCEIQHGNVSALHLPKNKYDLATAFETIYFWPGLEQCFTEVWNVLKPGGLFMIVNESDGMDELSLRYETIIQGMKCYTIEDIETALKHAGFSKIKATRHKSNPWITVLAKK